MELPVAAQLGEFAAALLWGAALAMGYDVFRALRRSTGLRHLWDGLFCLLVLPALWLFMLYPGRGLLRLGSLAGMGLGALAWFLTVGRVFLFLICQLFHYLGATIRFVLRPAKKLSFFLQKNIKKGFHFFRKRGTIILTQIRKIRVPYETGDRHAAAEIVDA